MSNVTKLDLINEVARETSVSAIEVRTAIETFFEVVEKQLSQNRYLEIRGFGSLFMKLRKPKLVRNPKRPQEIKTLPSRYSPVLQFSKEFKAAVNHPHGYEVEIKGNFHLVTVARDFVDTEIEMVSATIDKLLKEDPKNIILDFEQVRYIYSPGLSALIRYNQLAKEQGKQVYIVNIKVNVFNKLVSSNLDKVLTTFASWDDFEKANPA
jgi:anti-anti-sigma factor